MVFSNLLAAVVVGEQTVRQEKSRVRTNYKCASFSLHVVLDVFACGAVCDGAPMKFYRETRADGHSTPLAGGVAFVESSIVYPACR